MNFRTLNLVCIVLSVLCVHDVAHAQVKKNVKAVGTKSVASRQVKKSASKPLKKPPVKQSKKAPVVSEEVDLVVDSVSEEKNVQKNVRKNLIGKKTINKAFYYASGSFYSFADLVYAQVAGQKIRSRAVFTGYMVGTEYTRYMGRYLYSWNANILTGSVDIARVLGSTYPRRSFTGLQSGPELGYRVNRDLDMSWGLNLLYRSIEKVDGSFALSNQLNVKFRFNPRLTFFQSFGNYGKATAYSYSIGLRWLL